MNYWFECVSESLDALGIVLRKEQVETIASDMNDAHVNYWQFSGNDVADRNLSGSKDREISILQNKVREEQQKITCRECNGTGQIRSDGPCHYSISSCWKCHGNGRH